MSEHPADQDGQVSEVASLDPAEADTPISDADHVAGYPESESGSPDEGAETGPDARSGAEDEDDWYGGGRTPGDPHRDHGRD